MATACCRRTTWHIIALWRDDCQRVNGFDENYVGWGLEDRDLPRRLGRLGLRFRTILDLVGKRIGFVAPLGNVGDRLIEAATFQLLSEFGVRWQVVDPDTCPDADELVFGGLGSAAIRRSSAARPRSTSNWPPNTNTSSPIGCTSPSAA